MKTPHIDRLATEGAAFLNAFHTTPLCSPNRASIVTGQYASRHGVFDNIGRDALSHRLPNYHRDLQALGYETAHIGKWHMGNDARPRPGYDTWINFRGQGTIVDPVLWEDGGERQVPGYVTDLLSERAVDFVRRARTRPFALFLSHKAVHPDVQQRQDSAVDMSTLQGYMLPDRHRDLYKDGHYPMRPNVRPIAEVAAKGLRASTHGQSAHLDTARDRRRRLRSVPGGLQRSHQGDLVAASGFVEPKLYYLLRSLCLQNLPIACSERRSDRTREGRNARQDPRIAPRTPVRRTRSRRGLRTHEEPSRS